MKAGTLLYTVKKSRELVGEEEARIEEILDVCAIFPSTTSPNEGNPGRNISLPLDWSLVLIHVRPVKNKSMLIQDLTMGISSYLGAYTSGRTHFKFCFVFDQDCDDPERGYCCPLVMVMVSHFLVSCTGLSCPWGGGKAHYKDPPSKTDGFLNAVVKWA